MPERVVNRVVLLPVERIAPNPGQPRRVFSEESLWELARSIEQSGLLQPVTVRKTGPEEYELIAGERRLRAYKLLGYYEIPALIENADELSGRALALIENIQRAELNCFEQAAAMQALLDGQEIAQGELARRLGVSQPTVANKLRLLRLPDRAREIILEGGLTERHARSLLRLPDEAAQIHTAEKISREKMNVERAERYIDSLLEAARPKPDRRFIPKDLRVFFNTINKAVDVMRGAGIEAQAERTEDEEGFLITVRIPKRACVHK